MDGTSDITEHAIQFRCSVGAIDPRVGGRSARRSFQRALPSNLFSNPRHGREEDAFLYACPRSALRPCLTPCPTPDPSPRSCPTPLPHALPMRDGRLIHVHHSKSHTAIRPRGRAAGEVEGRGRDQFIEGLAPVHAIRGPNEPRGRQRAGEAVRIRDAQADVPAAGNPRLRPQPVQHGVQFPVVPLYIAVVEVVVVPLAGRVGGSLDLSFVNGGDQLYHGRGHRGLLECGEYFGHRAPSLHHGGIKFPRACQLVQANVSDEGPGRPAQPEC